MLPTSFGIRELAERAQRQGALDLTQGMIDAPPPAALIQAIRRLDFGRCSAYTNKRGVPLYRGALHLHLAQRGWPVSLDHIMATMGTTAGVAAALLSVCRPGDRVLLPEPFFIGHRLLLENLGFAIEFLPLSLTEPDWEAIQAKLPSVKAVILTSPLNPTGHFVSPDTLVKLAAAAAQHNTLLIIDEMYREFIWQDELARTSDAAYAILDLTSTVIFRSFSKTFAIPGWRLGWAVTDPSLIERMAATHDALYLGGSTLAQYAMADALATDPVSLKEYITNLRQQLMQNKVILERAFRSLNMNALPIPAAYYMLLQHNRASDMAAVDELLERGVAVVPLSLLCRDPSIDTGYIRIHFAVRPETAHAVADALR